MLSRCFSRFPILARTDESGRTREYSYDALGALASASDLGGADWAYDYDAFVAGDVVFDLESGRVGLGSSEQGDDTYRFTGGGGDGAVSMAMDAYRHALSSVTSPEGETTRWHRDPRGHIDLVEYPHGGVETRTYGTDGHEATRTLAHGTTLTYTRDGAGRPLERDGTDGSHIEWTYGASDRVETTTDSTGVTGFGYDAAGRWSGIDYPTASEWSRTFDALDRVTHVRVRESATATLRDTEYRYDAAGRIAEVIDPLGGHTTFDHDASGRMTRRELPNGVVTTWTYDARGWVDTLTHRRADATVIASLDYDRAPSGEPTRITREDGSYVEYGYDAALRLTEERYVAAGGAPEETITYAYDDDGNRTSRTTSVGTETYVYGPGSELRSISGASTASYAYDGAGRATRITRSGATRTLDYDADDHVVRVAQGSSEVRFQFDAQGRRVRAERMSAGVSEHASRYAIAPTGVEDLESPHLVTDDAGGAQLGYVFAGEHPLLRYDPTTGEVVYYLQDAMGSVVGLTDEDATATSTIHYDGFGNERRTTGTLTTLPIAAGGDFRFQGMWHDRDTGLYYVRARTYEAETGRFTTRDPLEGGRRAERHWVYSFARSVPTVFRDPSGLIETTMTGQMAAVAVAATLALISAQALNVAALQRTRVPEMEFPEPPSIREVIQAVGAVLAAAAMTTPQRACAALGIEWRRCSDALHKIKAAAGNGPADNVEVNPDTGDVYDLETGEYIGNLLEEAATSGRGRDGRGDRGGRGRGRGHDRDDDW